MVLMVSSFGDGQLRATSAAWMGTADADGLAASGVVIANDRQLRSDQDHDEFSRSGTRRCVQGYTNFTRMRKGASRPCCNARVSIYQPSQRSTRHKWSADGAAIPACFLVAFARQR